MATKLTEASSYIWYLMMFVTMATGARYAARNQGGVPAVGTLSILRARPASAVSQSSRKRKHFKDIGELIGVVTRPMTIAGHTVPMANLPYTLTSDAGHQLATGKPFAGCYWDTPDGRVFSLRSTDEGLDVSAIAKQYGGDGHRNASGFRVAYADLGQFEPSVS